MFTKSQFTVGIVNAGHLGKTSHCFVAHSSFFTHAGVIVCLEQLRFLSHLVRLFESESQNVSLGEY